VQKVLNRIFNQERKHNHKPIILGIILLKNISIKRLNTSINGQRTAFIVLLQTQWPPMCFTMLPHKPNSMAMKDLDRFKGIFFNLGVEVLQMWWEEGAGFKTRFYWYPCVGDPKIRENLGEHLSHLWKQWGRVKY